VKWPEGSIDKAPPPLGEEPCRGLPCRCKWCKVTRGCKATGVFHTLTAAGRARRVARVAAAGPAPPPDRNPRGGFVYLFIYIFIYAGLFTYLYIYLRGAGSHRVRVVRWARDPRRRRGVRAHGARGI